MSYGKITILVIGSLRSPPKGDTPEWYLKYMTPCFSLHTSRFPLRGNASKRQKGVREQSTDRMLHRGPDRQSAACVIFASYPWTHPAAADTKKRRLFKGAVLLPLFGYYCRNFFCLFFTGRFLHNLVNTDGEKGNQVEKDEGIGQGIVAFGNEVDNADFGEGH